jgi:cytochrome c-type biogenesis protein CcmE
MLSGTLKFVVGGLVVAVVIVVLIVSGFSGSTSEYVSIADARQALVGERAVRVVGEIVPDSVAWDARNLTLAFTIQDDTGTLPIVYHGPQPDMLVDAVEAVVVGHFDPALDAFTAEELLMKCPSKYEEAGS